MPERILPADNVGTGLAPCARQMWREVSHEFADHAPALQPPGHGQTVRVPMTVPALPDIELKIIPDRPILASDNTVGEPLQR